MSNHVAVVLGPLAIPKWVSQLSLAGIIIPQESSALAEWCSEHKVTLYIGSVETHLKSLNTGHQLLFLRADTEIQGEIPTNGLIEVQVWRHEHFSWRLRVIPVTAYSEVNRVGNVDPIWTAGSSIRSGVKFREDAFIPSAPEGPLGPGGKLLGPQPQNFPEGDFDHLYLAQGFLCENQPGKADEHLKSITAQDPELKYLVKFYQAHVEAALGHPEQAQVLYLEAYQMRPQRAEALHNLANWHLSQGNMPMVAMLARQAIGISLQGDKHYLYPVIYNQNCHHLLSLSAHASGDKKIGLQAINHLLLAPTTELQIRQMAEQNLIFYMEPIAASKFTQLPVDLPPLKIDTDFPEKSGMLKESSSDTYRPYNPSLMHLSAVGEMWQQPGAKYLVSCRSVNYDHQGDAYYAVDGTNIIKTRNFLLWMDANWQKICQKEIIDAIGGEMKSWVYGLEDLRLFAWKGGVWFQANNRMTHDIPQIVIGQLNPAGTVMSKILLSGERCEKNWLPYVQGDKLRFVYGHSPLTLTEFQSQELPKVITKIPSELNLKSFRGSGAPVPYKQGYLGVVHEVIFRQDGRHYHHRLVAYDAKMLPEKVSVPFYFKAKGIEFVAGLLITETEVVIGFGVEDKQAFLAHVPLKVIETLL
jgi:hypothetical protein